MVNSPPPPKKKRKKVEKGRATGEKGRKFSQRAGAKIFISILIYTPDIMCTDNILYCVNFDEL